jgi:fucose permease
MVTVLLGPMLPVLTARWSLTYTQAGYLFTTLFLGASLGVALSGKLIHRLGYRLSMVCGLAIIAAGVAAIPISSYTGGLLAIVCWGIAIGIMGPVCNLLIAEVHPHRRAAALNLLNVSWGIGAVSCPFLVAAAIQMQRISGLLFAIVAMTLAIAAGIATLASPQGELGRVAETAEPLPAIRWFHSDIVVLCAIFLLYVGTENGIGGWLASYARNIAPSQVSASITISSYFYLALLAGRWIAPLILRRASELTLARAALAVACGGIGGLLAARTMSQVIAAASIAGLGLSPIYPISISLLSGTFGAAKSRVGSVIFNMGNVGGATVPLVVGYMSHQFGTLRLGLAIVFAAGVLMLALYCRVLTEPQH